MWRENEMGRGGAQSLLTEEMVGTQKRKSWRKGGGGGERNDSEKGK